MKAEDTPTSSPTIQAFTSHGLLNLKNGLWNIINSEFVKLMIRNRTLENRLLRDFVSGIWSSIVEDGDQGMPYYTIELSLEMKKLFFAANLDEVVLFSQRIADCPDPLFNRQAYRSALDEMLNQYGMSDKKSTRGEDPRGPTFHYN